MDVIWEELQAAIPDKRQMVQLLVRLTIAALLGGVIGWQRERTGKEAGIRTHMLVTLGVTIVILGAMEYGMDSADLSRIIQGLVTGIGFLGGGAILKLQDKREIEGLTTAAGIWATAAIGIAAGLGKITLALAAVILTCLILSLDSKTGKPKAVNEEEKEYEQNQS